MRGSGVGREERGVGVEGRDNCDVGAAGKR